MTTVPGEPAHHADQPDQPNEPAVQPDGQPDTGDPLDPDDAG